MQSHGHDQNRADLFKQCRSVPADMAARMPGMQVRWRGSRGWALCPLHGEKTASLMFDLKGRWHCFGCGRGGDAVDLWAAFKGMAPLYAAADLWEQMGRVRLWQEK